MLSSSAGTAINDVQNDSGLHLNCIYNSTVALLTCGALHQAQYKRSLALDKLQLVSVHVAVILRFYGQAYYVGLYTLSACHFSWPFREKYLW